MVVGILLTVLAGYDAGKHGGDTAKSLQLGAVAGLSLGFAVRFAYKAGLREWEEGRWITRCWRTSAG